MNSSYREGASSVNPDEKGVFSTAKPGSCIHSVKNTKPYRLPSSGDAAIPQGGKTRITCPPTVVNGLDFLKVSFWLDWESGEIFGELERLKECIQSGEDNSAPFRVPGGFEWNLHRTGTSRYNFRLTSGDITLLLNRRRSDGVVPTARLEIGSISCWSPGFFSIYERIIRWLQVIGAKIVRESVSEVHLAADFVGHDINLLNIENENRWVSRVHKFNIHKDRRKLSGITLGKGDIMLRVYDKVLELLLAPHKQSIFSEIWKVPSFGHSPVTRIEFQLRRPVLKEFENKIETVKSLLFSLNALWQYCTGSWCRFCENEVNRNHNQSKAKNSQFWDIVSKLNWSGIHLIERKKRRQNKCLDQIKANIRGMAMTASAFYDPHPEDLDHIIGISQDIIREEMTKLYLDDQTTFTERMKRKRNEIYVNI